jgi:hypothetical protein
LARFFLYKKTGCFPTLHTGEFSLRPSWDLASEANPECLGSIMGLVGKVNLHASMDQQLIVIREADRLVKGSVVDPTILVRFRIRGSSSD